MCQNPHATKESHTRMQSAILAESSLFRCTLTLIMHVTWPHERVAFAERAINLLLFDQRSYPPPMILVMDIIMYMSSTNRDHSTFKLQL